MARFAIAPVLLVVATLAVRDAGAAEPITFAHAATAGAAAGPASVEARRNRDAARTFAGSDASSLPSTPTVTVLAGARKPYNLPTGPEVVLTVAQEFSPRSLGQARRRATEWADRAAVADVDRARIEGAAVATLAWVDLLESQARLALRVAAADDAKELARIAEVRVQSGAATAVERALATSEVGNARLAVLDEEGRRTEARLALAHATGARADAELLATGDLDEVADAGAGPPRRPGRHPLVVAAEARASQAEADADVAHAALGPRFALGASVWREGSGDHAAAAVVTIPLPILDPASHDVGRQRLAASAMANHARRVGSELERDILLAVHEREHSREVRAEVRASLVGPLRTAVKSATLAYAAGTADLAVVLLARRAALGAEERLVVAAGDVRRADIRLTALTGTLPGGAAR